MTDAARALWLAVGRSAHAMVAHLRQWRAKQAPRLRSSKGAAKVFAFAVPVAAFFAFANLGQNHAAPHRYLTAPVDVGSIRTTLAATGSIQAVVTARVGSQLSGQIEDVLVDFNDSVKKGQTMARLDSRNLKAKVRAAEAALQVAKAKVTITRAALTKMEAELARSESGVDYAHARVKGARAKAENAKLTFERKSALVAKGVVGQAQLGDIEVFSSTSEADLLAAEAELEAAEGAIRSTNASREMAAADLALAEAAVKQAAAALEQAETDLSHTEIRATIDGTVIGRDIEIGQTVAATLEAPTLFLIAQDLRQLEVYARIDEADIGHIAVGQRATFTVDAFPGRTFTASVAQLRKAPSVVQNVVTYTVVLATENPDLKLLPGMTAVLQIVVDEAANVARIPNAALRYQPPKEFASNADRVLRDDAKSRGAGPSSVVWVLSEGGEPKPVAVRTGLSDAVSTEVTAGMLAAGRQVIVATMPGSSGSTFFGLRWGL
ncbi:MAG: efflux RND transporter periplasmic adaptor subunit [Hyphomicrobiaceae bacterium]|nr:efflux RND transporter periplasmic adaptor subunit [Hyphomicrobiaceae bacterium]